MYTDSTRIGTPAAQAQADSAFQVLAPDNCSVADDPLVKLIAAERCLAVRGALAKLERRRPGVSASELRRGVDFRTRRRGAGSDRRKRSSPSPSNPALCGWSAGCNTTTGQGTQGLGMPEHLTCGEVEAQDLIQRYGARTLSEHEAEALERHVLDCGTCWEELQAALDVRAALVAAPETASIPERAVLITRPRRRLWSFAAVAAGIAIAVATAWQVGRRPTGDTPVFRGADEELAIVPSWAVRRRASLPPGLRFLAGRVTA